MELGSITRLASIGLRCNQKGRLTGARASIIPIPSKVCINSGLVMGAAALRWCLCAYAADLVIDIELHVRVSDNYRALCACKSSRSSSLTETESTCAVGACFKIPSALKILRVSLRFCVYRHISLIKGFNYNDVNHLALSMKRT